MVDGEESVAPRRLEEGPSFVKALLTSTTMAVMSAKGMEHLSRRGVFHLSVLDLRMMSPAAHRLWIPKFTLSKLVGEANASASMVKRTPTLFKAPNWIAWTVASTRASADPTLLRMSDPSSSLL